MSDRKHIIATVGGAAWWAESRSQARAASVLIAVLVAVLLGVSAYVWASPPVSSTVPAATDPLER